ncbi:MAG: hypothetical protein A3J75_00455 [Acidobacteria bacterium RBG_16_68_9]|nr:MAG: hypothetical protein A3J75_00455 [Acidobacteria bacterium RBG_16_68_9]
MRRSSGLLGILGITFLLFAGVAFWLTRARGPFDLLYVAVHGGAGALALIAYLTAGVDNLRGFLGERSTKYGANTVLASVLFVAILGVLAYLSTRYHHRFDLTEANVFSLSPQSAQVVKSLDKDLRLQAFVEGGINPQVRDLLDSYRYASSTVSFEMIDPDRHPELAEQYKISQYNTVHVEYGEASTTVSTPTEEAITNAIIKLTRAAQQTVCFIEGHGEADIGAAEDARGMSQAKLALENENYQVKKVLLLNQESVPSECSVVLVAGPAKPYFEHELRGIERHLRGGGRAMFLLPPRAGAEFQPFLANWGVKLGDDVVVDQVLRLFQGPALGLEPLAETYGAHDITRDFKGRTIFPMTRSVQSEAAGKKGLQVSELVKTSPSSWAETDLAGLFERHEARLDEDQKGPISIAAAVEAQLKEMGEEKDGVARLAVFGSAQFADNRNLEGTFYNRDLFLNAVGWLVGQADLLSIRPRTLRASRVSFSQEEGTIIFYLSVLLVPELLLIAGLAVWWRRE